MNTYEVTVWASYTTQVEADSIDEAEEQAFEESPFPYADHYDTTEIE